MDKSPPFFRHPFKSRAFFLALLFNTLWINLSEVLRYFGLVKPMLHGAFPESDAIANVTPVIFVFWIVWDTILVIAATAFYWIFLERNGMSGRNAILAASYFTVTVFGLLWLGVINMGLAPAIIGITAFPLAWLEQSIAAMIVYVCLSRALKNQTDA